MKNPFKAAYKSVVSPIARMIVSAARKDFERAIVIPLDGGLGPQMWGYTVGRAAAALSGLPALYDLSRFESGTCEMESAFPEISLQRAPDDIARLYRRYFFTGDPDGDPMAYDEAVLRSGSLRYLGGRYLNAAYVDGQGDALRDGFAFKPVLSEEARFIFSSVYVEDLPVAVHLTPGIVSERYFRLSVRTISERLAPAKPVFFVFADSEALAADVLSDTGQEFVYADHGQSDEATRMYLMSRCKHFVVSNSLLGWWAAWLSRESHDKIVTVPDKWLPESRHADARAMAASGWTVLPGE